MSLSNDILGEGVEVSIPGYKDPDGLVPPYTEDFGNGITHSVDKNWNSAWYKDGVLHRDGDQPAYESGGDDVSKWYRNGKLHRDGDQPAVIDDSGYDSYEAWYRDGKLHRDGDLPAKVYGDGVLCWYWNGKLHRDAGPAITKDGEGYRAWYSHGKKHRVGGPAVVDGRTLEYWVHGKRVDPGSTRV